VPSRRRASWAPVGSWPRSSPWQCSARPGRSECLPPAAEQSLGEGCPSGIAATPSHPQVCRGVPNTPQHPWCPLRRSPQTFPTPASQGSKPHSCISKVGDALLAARLCQSSSKPPTALASLTPPQPRSTRNGDAAARLAAWAHVNGALQHLSTQGLRGHTHLCAQGVSGHMPTLAEDAGRTWTHDPNTELEMSTWTWTSQDSAPALQQGNASPLPPHRTSLRASIPARCHSQGTMRSHQPLPYIQDGYSPALASPW